MRILKLAGIWCVFLVLSGCAVGNEYDYQNASVSLPLAGSGEVAVAVVDNRSYVLNGDKDPDFIGVQRGGFSNPFNVTTTSGNSLTEDMAVALESALRDSGYNVSSLSDPSAIVDSGNLRNIVLTVTEWKTDIYLKMTLDFNLLLQVLGQDGETIATNRAQGNEVIGGGGLQSQNAETARATFETKIGRLFNNEAIIGALKAE